MKGRMTGTFALAGALACGLSVPAWGAADADRAQQLERQVQQLQSRVAELETKENQDWMTQRRAEEVKTLIRDVLSDAETRSTLLQEGMTAGHDGGFFLRSADGAFLLELAGHLQVRYIWNNRDNSGADDNEAGFQLRRTKFKGEGHIGSPRIKYDFSLAGDRDDEKTIFEDYTMSYDFTDTLSIKGGRWKQPFAMQEMVSSSRQLPVERSLVHEVFNVGRSEGVGLEYATDRFRAYAVTNNGKGGDFSDFDTNTVDAAFVGRVEALLAGEWGQFKDPGTAWQGEDTGAMVGVAGYYEIGETGDGQAANDNDDLLMWTVDGSVESNGFGIFAAAYGMHSTGAGATADFDDFGFLVEGGYFIVPDEIQPFARYELIIQDDARAGVGTDTEEETNLITAGFNWYQHKHDAKFTMDVVYALDPIRGDFLDPSTGLGLLEDAAGGEDGQFALRTQYQLKF